MIDRFTKLKAALKVSGTALNATVGNNVCYPIYPQGLKNPEPYLVFDLLVGGRPPSAATQSAEFNVRIYGGSDSFEDVQSIFRKLHDWCYTLIPAGTQKAWATISGIEKVTIATDFSGGKDPETKWPVHHAVLLVLFAT